jgi:predicted RNase H-like HicB family nuclease
MHNLKYVIYRDGNYYVSQCLNVDVSSFGTTIDEAIANLKEAVELYLEDNNTLETYRDVGDALIGEATINA